MNEIKCIEMITNSVEYNNLSSFVFTLILTDPESYNKQHPLLKSLLNNPFLKDETKALS